MAVRTLPSAVTVHRLGDPDGLYPVYSGIGAAMYPGRWNETDQRVIYTAEHYSTALLEKLARTGKMPSRQNRLEAILPAGSSYEEVGPESVKGWDDAEKRASRRFGSTWYEERRSLVLFVPSVLAWPDRNVLINEAHEKAGGVTVGREVLVRWDERLFGG